MTTKQSKTKPTVEELAARLGVVESKCRHLIDPIEQARKDLEADQRRAERDAKAKAAAEAAHVAIENMVTVEPHLLQQLGELASRMNRGPHARGPNHRWQHVEVAALLRARGYRVPSSVGCLLRGLRGSCRTGIFTGPAPGLSRIAGKVSWALLHIEHYKALGYFTNLSFF